MSGFRDFLSQPWKHPIKATVLCTKCGHFAPVQGQEPLCPKDGERLQVIRGEKVHVDSLLADYLEPKIPMEAARAIYFEERRLNTCHMPCYPYDDFENGWVGWDKQSGGSQRGMVQDWLSSILDRLKRQRERAEGELGRIENPPPPSKDGSIGFSIFETVGVGYYNPGPRTQSYPALLDRPVSLEDYEWPMMPSPK